VQRHWQQYLKDGQPAWHKIAVSGQSQGGMAQYLGKKESLARIISFSGGWDFSSRGHIANWYYTPGVTPTERWYATYNVKEGFADEMHQISLALGIPSKHIFALDKPLLERRKPLPANKPDWAPAHGDGLSNIAYQDVWRTMLGSGLHQIKTNQQSGEISFKRAPDNNHAQKEISSLFVIHPVHSIQATHLMTGGPLKRLRSPKTHQNRIRKIDRPTIKYSTFSFGG
jgi:signal transduction histidine kinase